MSTPRTLPSRALLVVLLASTPASQLSAETWFDGSPLVANPCGILQPTEHCFQATFTNPRRGESIVVGSTPTYTFRGVAERESDVLLYFANEDGALVSLQPLHAPASINGNFSLAVDLRNFPHGSYNVAAYYRTSINEHDEDASFHQLTGVPGTAFRTTVDTTAPPPPPPPPPPGTCAVNMSAIDPEVLQANGIDTLIDLPAEFGNVKLAKENNYPGGGRSRTFFLLREANTGSAAALENVRLHIYSKTLHEMKKVLCQRITAREDLTGDARLEEQVRQTLLAVGLNPATVTVDYQGPLGLTIPEIHARLKQLMQTESGCTQADAAALDLTWAQFSMDDVVLGWIFARRDLYDVPDTTTLNRILPGKDGVCSFELTYASGESPLIFLSSDTFIDAIVNPHPLGGVTFSIPEKPAGGWEVRVSPDASTVPLYYEFGAAASAQFTPLPGSWIVPGAEVETSIRTLLSGLGYDAGEVEAFIARDITPVLPESPFVRLRLVDPAQLAVAVPLDVHPTPARIERILFQLEVLEDAPSIAPEAPDVSAFVHEEAPGLTLREFGAVFARAATPR